MVYFACLTACYAGASASPSVVLLRMLDHPLLLLFSSAGGRQLDYAPSALEVLPAIAKAVNKRVPIFMVSVQGWASM